MGVPEVLVWTQELSLTTDFTINSSNSPGQILKHAPMFVPSMMPFVFEQLHRDAVAVGAG